MKKTKFSIQYKFQNENVEFQLCNGSLSINFYIICTEQYLFKQARLEK